MVNNRMSSNVKCVTTNARKKNAMKKHVKTKHVEQKCKTCDKVILSTMEVLMHTASEHSKNIREDQKEIKSVPQTQNIKEDTLCFGIATKFKFFKCKEIVSIKDKFNDSLEEEQMCKLCRLSRLTVNALVRQEE